MSNINPPVTASFNLGNELYMRLQDNTSITIKNPDLLNTLKQRTAVSIGISMCASENPELKKNGESILLQLASTGYLPAICKLIDIYECHLENPTLSTLAIQEQRDLIKETYMYKTDPDFK